MIGNKKDKDISVKSPSAFSKAIRNKWLLWGIVAMAVIFYFATKAADKGDGRDRRSVEAEFTDSTPGVKSSQELSLSRLQRQLDKTQKALAEKTDQDKKTIRALRESLEKEKEHRSEEVERLKASSKELKEKLRRERHSSPKSASKSGKPDSSNGSASNDTDSYIRPPKIGGDGPIAPPNLRRTDGDSEKPRASLPSRKNNTRRASSGHGQATILRGDDTTNDGGAATVLSGPDSEEQSPSEYQDLNGMLPMGSFMETVILTGADFGASTKSQSNPQPTLLRIQDNSFLPNHAQYDLQDCFAMGAGYGDLSSERAYITGTRISCVHQETGQILEAEVQSYMVDSDGRLGMRGKVDRRSGAVMGKAMVAGFAEGAAKILSAASMDTTNTITGSGVVSTTDTSKLAQAGGFSGAGRAAEILADQYLEEAESMYPVIAVNAGRKSHLVIQVGQKLKWKPVNGQEEE